VTDWTQLSYNDQLQAKVGWLNELLSPLTTLSPEVFRSAEHSYRMRAEFRAWHEGDDTFYAMYEPGTNQTYGIRDFPPASRAIRDLMPRLMDAIKAEEILRKRLFRIEFLSTTTDEILVTLIYHKPLDDQWKKTAEDMTSALGINLIGRAKKTKILLGNDYVTETLKIDDQSYQMRQIESTFTQPNAGVNEQMVRWACQQAQSIENASNTDLLELYCGNGNFSLPLSRFYRNVLTTEISKGSIAALKWNLEANRISNVEHARLSAEEVTQTLDRVRPFRRLSHIDLDSYQFSTIFVDPPRAGVDTKTMELVRRFDNIIYISCNPETLKLNLEQIADTHEITATAAFDQFPFTPHLEAGVCLKRK
jgi:tRNA (uracil-5-)-methyltransferase